MVDADAGPVLRLSARAESIERDHEARTLSTHF